MVALFACQRGSDVQLEHAREMIQAGDFSGAIEPLREVLSENPAHPDANYMLGLAYLQTGQPSLATWPLEKAAASDERAVAAGLMLASTYLATEQYGSAVTAATRVLEGEPERTDALHTRAHAYLGAGQPEKALRDAELLLELDPDRYGALLLLASAQAELDDLDGAERTHIRMREVATLESPEVAVRGCLALADFYEGNRHDTERAGATYRECLEDHPTAPLALRMGSNFLDKTGATAETLALWRRAFELEPGNPAIRQQLAGRLAGAGEVEEGRRLLTEATVEGGVSAWAALAEFERGQGDLAAAGAALNRAAELAPEGTGEELLFHRADLLIDGGDLEGAESLIEQITRDEYHHLLNGRLLMERGETEAALAALEAGLERWPNNAGGRYLAGRAAYDLGDIETAKDHLREATRADVAATDAAVLLARIYLSEGRFSDATIMVQRHVATHATSPPEALLLHARATSQLGKYEVARTTLDNLEQSEGRSARSVAERAAVERLAEGPEAAVRVVRDSGLDLLRAENALALGALVEDLANLGRVDEAIALAHQAATAESDSAELVTLYAAVLLRVGKTEKARDAFERALELDAASAPALTGLGQIAAAGGDTQAAVEFFDRARLADPSETAAAYAAAQLALADGRSDEAESRLEGVLRRDPGHAYASNDLAWLLAARGADLERALALATRAVRLEPSPETRDTLGWVQLRAGRNDAAILSFQDALAEDPDAAAIWYHMGLAQAGAGATSEALVSFRASLEKGPFLDADAARAEIARLEQQ